MSKIYDLVIIGAGPAGITAGVYAARKRMDLVVLTVDIGGQTALSGDVENYTGYQFITGVELASKFEEHMKRYNIAVKENEPVASLEKKGDVVEAKTLKGTYSAKTAIIASGKRSKELGIPGEKEYKNKGLTYCATCDGPLFEGKIVAVVGGGNSALDAAIQLINIAKHVYILNINPKLAGDPIMREKVVSNSKVTVLNNSKILEVFGDGFVKGIKFIKDDKEELLNIEGIFVEIGLIPNSEFTRGIEKNELGEILVNPQAETNLAGIFAAGDVTNVIEKQIIIAAGEGSKAALSAFRYLASK